MQRASSSGSWYLTWERGQIEEYLDIGGQSLRVKHLARGQTKHLVVRRPPNLGPWFVPRCRSKQKTSTVWGIRLERGHKTSSILVD